MNRTTQTVLFAVGLGILGARFAAACTPAERLTVENASAVAQYDASLVDCKKKAAGNFAVYELCETTVTREFCRSSEALRKEWSKCKETP